MPKRSCPNFVWAGFAETRFPASATPGHTNEDAIAEAGRQRLHYLAKAVMLHTLYSVSARSNSSRNVGRSLNVPAIFGSAKTRTRFTKSSNCVLASASTTGETRLSG